MKTGFECFFRPSITIQVTKDQLNVLTGGENLNQKPKVYLCNDKHEVISEIELKE